MIKDLRVSKVIGIILAGGEGRRMAYRNKGLMPLAGKAMIAHVIARILPQVDALYISANEDLEQYAIFQLPVIQDMPQWRGKGPLAGVASVLKELSDDDVIQVVSCDGPMIPDNLVALLSAARKDAKMVYPTTKDREHYLYFQGKVGDLREIESILVANDLRMRTFLAKLGAKAVYFEDEMAFLNCNHPEDIQRLEEIIDEEL